VRGRCSPRQTLQPFLSVEKRQDLLDLADPLEAGQLKPVIDRTYPLSEAAEALRYVALATPEGRPSSPSERRDTTQRHPHRTHPGSAALG